MLYVRFLNMSASENIQITIRYPWRCWPTESESSYVTNESEAEAKTEKAFKAKLRMILHWVSLACCSNLDLKQVINCNSVRWFLCKNPNLGQWQHKSGLADKSDLITAEYTQKG